MAGLMHDALLVAGAIAVCVTFGLLFWLYGRLKEGPRPRHGMPAQGMPWQNMAELTILFQTMRGLVREQKTLARDFNRSLDAKVEVVREAVRQVLAAYEQLMRMQKALKAQMEQARQEQADSPADESVEDGFRALRAIATPDAADPIDNWQPLLPDPEAVEDLPAEAAPERTAYDAAPSRAVRDALLNMGEPPEMAVPPAASGMGEHALGPLLDEAAPAAPTNGAAALRSRVYKYHDAGMNISAIAQELGLGKGEIRLMLSLRDK